MADFLLGVPFYKRILQEDGQTGKGEIEIGDWRLGIGGRWDRVGER